MIVCKLQIKDVPSSHLFNDCSLNIYDRLERGLITDCFKNQTNFPFSLHRACRFIYTLMQTEYSNNNCHNTRFIPLLFPGATSDDIPMWLQNTICYRWRDHWQDVLFRLLEPRRIMRSIKINEEKFSPVIRSRQTWCEEGVCYKRSSCQFLRWWEFIINPCMEPWPWNDQFLLDAHFVFF